MLTFSFSAGGPLTFGFAIKCLNFLTEQTQIIDSLLVYMQNKVDLINIETEKIEYYYLHPFSRFPYYSQIIVSYLCQLFLSLAEQGILSSVSSVPDAITFRNAINFKYES